MNHIPDLADYKAFRNVLARQIAEKWARENPNNIRAELYADFDATIAKLEADSNKATA